jgi:hypothetical protein
MIRKLTNDGLPGERAPKRARAGFQSNRSRALRRDCCGSAPCGNARTAPRSGASDPAACCHRDCGRRPTGCRCDAATGRGRATTAHSATLGQCHKALTTEHDMGVLPASHLDRRAAVVPWRSSRNKAGYALNQLWLGGSADIMPVIDGLVYGTPQIQQY